MSKRYKNHRVFIVSASKVDEVNAAMERNGFGSGTFSVELTSKTSNTVTHYACSLTLDDAMLGIVQRLCKADPASIEKEGKFEDAVNGEALKRKLPPPEK